MRREESDLVVAVSAKEEIKGTEAAALMAWSVAVATGEALGQIDKSKWKFLWLTGFPLFEWSETDKSWVSTQHPFTGIVDEDLEKLETSAVGSAFEGLRPGVEWRGNWV